MFGSLVLITFVDYLVGMVLLCVFFIHLFMYPSSCVTHSNII
uniref:Uncharacterized protein n=1 Tax=Rhizophora mucronata TaxID=61149 RepID=A0A2P2QIG6_RHIMU